MAALVGAVDSDAGVGGCDVELKRGLVGGNSASDTNEVKKVVSCRHH